MPNRSWLAVVLALSLAAAACGDSGGDPDDGAVADGTDEAADGATDGDAAATDGATGGGGAGDGVIVDEHGDPVAIPTVRSGVTQVGITLLDGATGLTLYVFDEDSDGESTCVDACADTWPPLLVDGDVAPATDVSHLDFSLVTHPDGGMQLAVGERPLYTFSGDAENGEANGHGSGEVWFAAGADGEPLPVDPSAPVGRPTEP